MKKQSLPEIVKEIAYDVYKELGSGYSEDVYDKAMQVGLKIRSLDFESQKVVEVKYKDRYVGEGYPDLIVRRGGEILVVELKAVGKIGVAEQRQVKNYMKTLGVEWGMLVNFPQPKKEEVSASNVEVVNITPFKKLKVK